MKTKTLLNMKASSGLSLEMRNLPCHPVFSLGGQRGCPPYAVITQTSPLESVLRSPNWQFGRTKLKLELRTKYLGVQTGSLAEPS
jgi:hypothetical protein